jgi:hypothetical protein
MNKKLAPVMTLTLLLVGIFGIVIEVHGVRASETIYVMADSSIDPLTVNITSADNFTYKSADNNYA